MLHHIFRSFFMGFRNIVRGDSVAQPVNRIVATHIDEADPDKFLLGLLRRAIANRENVSVSHAESGEQVILLPERAEYFEYISDMEKFCRLPAKSLKVTVMNNEEVLKACPAKDVGRNMDELMWQAAYHISRGRLISGCKQDDVVHLKTWPNLTRLPHTENMMRIAALFSRYPTSVVLAKHILKVPDDELYQFYSAARCSGIAVSVNRKPDARAEQLKPHKNQTLLSRILRRISDI